MSKPSDREADLIDRYLADDELRDRVMCFIQRELSRRDASADPMERAAITHILDGIEAAVLCAECRRDDAIGRLRPAIIAEWLRERLAEVEGK